MTGDLALVVGRQSKEDYHQFQDAVDAKGTG